MRVVGFRAVRRPAGRHSNRERGRTDEPEGEDDHHCQVRPQKAHLRKILREWHRKCDRESRTRRESRSRGDSSPSRECRGRRQGPGVPPGSPFAGLRWGAAQPALDPGSLNVAPPAMGSVGRESACRRPRANPRPATVAWACGSPTSRGSSPASGADGHQDEAGRIGRTLGRGKRRVHGARPSAVPYPSRLRGIAAQRHRRQGNGRVRDVELSLAARRASPAQTLVFPQCQRALDLAFPPCPLPWRRTSRAPGHPAPELGDCPTKAFSAKRI